MPVFQITTVKPEPRLDARLPQHYPGGAFFKLSDRAWFVRGFDSPQSVGQKIGVKSIVPGASGTVALAALDEIAITQLFPAYWGWASSDLWAWLQTSFHVSS